jgi:hypothetical protein
VRSFLIGLALGILLALYLTHTPLSAFATALGDTVVTLEERYDLPSRDWSAYWR